MKHYLRANSETIYLAEAFRDYSHHQRYVKKISCVNFS